MENIWLSLFRGKKCEYWSLDRCFICNKRIPEGHIAGYDSMGIVYCQDCVDTIVNGKMSSDEILKRIMKDKLRHFKKTLQKKVDKNDR